MPHERFVPLVNVLVFLCAEAFAITFGSVRGIVHDPGHRPIEGAQVTIHARGSDWSAKTKSDADGEFHFDAVPVGGYEITVDAANFAPSEQEISVTTIDNPVFHFQLELGAMKQAVEVSATTSKLSTQSSTLQITVSQPQIAQTPGADQTNSLAMITDFVPGATMVHDMLHVRGGHQVNWFIDGIPVLNTSIAENVAPLINPKNVESLEV
jgi:hypothetical protein